MLFRLLMLFRIAAIGCTLQGMDGGFGRDAYGHGNKGSAKHSHDIMVGIVDGVGVQPPEQFTMEAVMVRAAKVHVHGFIPGIVQAFGKNVVAFLRAWRCGK